MASVYVVDSTFKRTQIKVTPGKYLQEVLEEACKSRKLNSEAFTLKSQANKVLDLSQPFRLSGLSAGAKLQLVQASRSPSVVSVALQLPEEYGGTRLSDKFASNTSLWLVLRKFEEGVVGQTQSKLNLTQQAVPSSNTGAGRLLYRQPCLNAMGRTLDTFSELQKTLSQLGLSSGSVLMRLSYKDSNRPLEEAMAEMSKYFETNLEIEPGQTPAAKATTAENDLPTPDQPLAPVVPDSQPAESANIVQTDDEQSVETDSMHPLDSMAIYLPPTSTTPAAALQDDHESVFEPGIDDARAHQASLTRASRNTRLLSDKELEEQEAERQAKLSAVQDVGIRVRYPDQSMIEITVQASETAAALYTRVRNVLRHPSEPFDLRFAGNKGHQTLPDDATKLLVKHFGFRGKVLVTLIWSPEASKQARSDPSLQDQFRSKAQELKVNLEQQGRDIQEAARSNEAKPPTANASSGKSKVDREAKMMKFLGFGKK